MNRAERSLRFRVSHLYVWLLASMSCWIVGCGIGRVRPNASPSTVAAAPAPLRVAAASDLQAALPRLSERFRQERHA